MLSWCLLLSVVALGQEVGLKKLPELEFKGMSGEKVELNRLLQKKQLTIVSFWATWCKPCLQELEEVNELYEDWQSDYDVQFIAVSTDNSRQSSKVKSLALSKGWEFDVVLDPEQRAKRLLNFSNTPFLLIVNQKGDVLYSHSGYLPGFEDELEEKLASLIQ